MARRGWRSAAPWAESGDDARLLAAWPTKKTAVVIAQELGRSLSAVYKRSSLLRLPDRRTIARIETPASVVAAAPRYYDKGAAGQIKRRGAPGALRRDPPPASANEKKMRKCLGGCDQQFWSDHIGHRICHSCAGRGHAVGNSRRRGG